jgi:AAA+ superfamily predicted ATPase
VSEVFEELASRLRYTDLLLLRAVRRQRARPAVRAKGQFWGQVITDDEVDALLRAHGEFDAPIEDDGLELALEASVRLRDAAGGKFARLREAFGLDGDDVDLLLLAIAPEIAAGYGRIFGYLNDELARPYLTVDLATRVLRTNRTERLDLLNRLLPGSPLIRNRVLLLHPAEGVEVHASRRLFPAPRLLRWLLAGEELPEGAGLASLPTDVAPFVPAVTAERIVELAGTLREAVNIAIVGGTVGMREGVAQAIARNAGRPLLRVELDRARAWLDEPYEIVRDLRLTGALPYVVGLQASQEDPSLRTQLATLGVALSSLPYPVLVGGADRRAIGAVLGSDRPSVTVAVGRSTLDERTEAWADAIVRRGWHRELADGVAERFHAVGGTTIERVLARAHAEAGGREPSTDVLWAAAREGSRPEFRGLALQVVPKFTFGDLIVSEKVMGQLQHLVHTLAEQEQVYHRWGADKVRARGFGLKALFSGGPGTGKTMAAEAIAGSLGLDLFRVDLSSVVSRWVGETEKNLREIFDSAEGANAVLLFDEADALFGSRGEVKDAQDRFANQEVSFLLQRLEVFEGCAILTTNLQENIDEAFLRRFGGVIEFPLPGVSERTRLWEKSIPPRAPRDPELDLSHLARQFPIAGGAIVNAAINACILASSRREPVALAHCLQAVARELIKNGKQVNRVHFGEYYDLVKDL